MINSLFHDKAEVRKQNLACIRPLVEQARCCHLLPGCDLTSLVETIDDLGR